MHCEYTDRCGYLSAVTGRRTADLALGAALVVFWSSGFIGSELGTGSATATTLLVWRFLAAAVVLGVVVGIRGRLERAGLGRTALLGLLIQALYLGGVVAGIGLGVPAGTAALIAATQPLLVAAVGPEHTSARQRTGLVVGLLGVGLVVAGDLGPGAAPWWAFLLPLGGTVALAGGTVLERRWRPPQDPLESLAVQTAAAAVAWLAVAAATGRLQPPADATFWWAVAWTVVLSGFGGYGSYLLVLRSGGAMRASTLLYLTPPVTALWAWAMFGDAPTPLALPGAVCAAVGAALVLGRSRRGRARTPAGARP